MPPFLYRCPNTGQRVQGFVADKPEENDEEYRSVACLACAQMHFVNSSTGRVLGADEE
jgi:hypothetical protein